ncbi:NAD(P)H-dependent oxidoreductase [Candidatus Pelagibacter ubique]|nr:NAD(P)H-dependent oxidoreductase [Candidatus Pelagibacter ubique]
MKNILGISTSLRNKRFSYKNSLVEEIKNNSSLKELSNFINNQIKVTFKDIEQSDQKLNFEEKYRELKKHKGNRGLSNSETALVYALWQASKVNDIQIDYLSLSNIFENEDENKLKFFKKKFLSCDGLLVSGPVYFGDRGSLTQRMIEYLNTDKDCMEHAKNIIYAGLSVGAKRNGGQETTLIFQLLDFLNLNSKVIGNGHETTAQYGGTLVAGDIGMIVKDEYGINTALSVGKNLAETLNKINIKKETSTRKKKFKCNIFILQDNQSQDCTNVVKDMIESNLNNQIEYKIFETFDKKIHKCIACDLCPISYGDKENYRCIINNSDDFFKKYHKEIIDCDGFIFAVYSGTNFINVKSNYQQFIERTRYLRRDDYLLGGKMATSLVVSEVNSNRNLHIRILTSLIRHNNILSKPIHVFKNKNEYINIKNSYNTFKEFGEAITKLEPHTTQKEYRPLGYEISYEKYLTKKK